jgi:hypothetical protein
MILGYPFSVDCYKLVLQEKRKVRILGINASPEVLTAKP